MPASSSFRGRDTIQFMPIAAMALVVLLLGVLLWLLHRNEVEDETRALIQDSLWVEQNLHFTLESDHERLAQLAEMVGRGGFGQAGLDAHVRSLMNNSPELVAVLLRREDGSVSRAMPPAEGDPGRLGDPNWLTGFSLMRGGGHEVWGQPYPVAGAGQYFEVQTPVFIQGRLAGAVVGVFSLDGLLGSHVPWWFAQAYQLEILDEGGAVLSRRPQGPSVASELVHRLRFEPPGQGLVLAVTALRSDPHLARNILAAAIVFLALSAVWSLWALRRHVRRRLAAEQALRAEHAFRKAMEDSLTVGMRARDLEGRITYANPAFCRMVGWPAEELVGAVPPMPYWVPEDMEHTLALHQAVLRGDAPPDGFEIVFRRKSGERFNALVYEAPLIDSEGRHTGWMASVLDVTERRKAEEVARLHQEKLQRTSRLITMGEMASALAHELNQPLSAIASYATGCLNRLDVPTAQAGELKMPLSKLALQAQRAGHIIRRMHDFVRKSDPMVAPCSLNAVVEGAVGFLEAEARKRSVRVALSLDPEAPMVDADRILMEQVVLNLVRNAMEATNQASRNERLVRVSVEHQDGIALVRVADRGPGIAAELAENLFTPFFTTKPEGMGMGLNICRSIVESHRGRLWYESDPEGGAVFLFTLPERAP